MWLGHVWAWTVREVSSHSRGPAVCASVPAGLGTCPQNSPPGAAWPARSYLPMLLPGPAETPTHPRR